MSYLLNRKVKQREGCYSVRGVGFGLNLSKCVWMQNYATLARGLAKIAHLLFAFESVADFQLTWPTVFPVPALLGHDSLFLWFVCQLHWISIRLRHLSVSLPMYFYLHYLHSTVNVGGKKPTTTTKQQLQILSRCNEYICVDFSCGMCVKTCLRLHSYV